MVYTRESLEGFYHDTLRKVDGKTATEREARLCVAAGHALDLMDVVDAADGDWTLDLTVETEGSVAISVSLLHLANLAAGMTLDESRETIIKKIGSYELFAIYNELLKNGYEADFATEGDNVLIASTGEQGGPVAFDVYRRVRYAISRFDLAPTPDDGYVALGTMKPFYDKLIHDFFEKLP